MSLTSSDRYSESQAGLGHRMSVKLEIVPSLA